MTTTTIKALVSVIIAIVVSAPAFAAECGKPEALLQAFVTGASAGPASVERALLKDLAVEQVKCFQGRLPQTNAKGRYNVILRLLQAMTGLNMGVTTPDELKLKSKRWRQRR